MASLVSTASRAAKSLGRETIVVSGGVAANGALRDAFLQTGFRVLFPPSGLNTDNGAMMALAGFVRAARGDVSDGFNHGVEPYWPLAAGQGSGRVDEDSRNASERHEGESKPMRRATHPNA